MAGTGQKVDANLQQVQNEILKISARGKIQCLFCEVLPIGSGLCNSS